MAKLERAQRRALKHAAVQRGMTETAQALGSAWAIADDEGTLLAGSEQAISLPGQFMERAGWIALTLHASTAALPALAATLKALLDLEQERTALANEALLAYREINLLFDIHEVIGSTMDKQQVMEHLVREAEGLIPGCEGVLLMLLDIIQNLQHVAGSAAHYPAELAFGQGLAGHAFVNRRADIAEDARLAPGYAGETDFASVMLAPLHSSGIDMGVLLVGSTEPVSFTANDLKMLSTLASHGAIVLENVRLYEEMRELFHSTVYTLAETIEKRDPYTGGHTQRVMDYAIMTAHALGMSHKDVEDLRLSAVLHDVGKIAVSDAILKKPEKLDQDEFKLMMRHTEDGADILKGSRHLRAIIAGVRFHHERYDGLGYNLGLKGHEIPMMARIIAVVDAFDAMTTDRPYRKGFGFDKAAEELLRGCGAQFDPDVVEKFIQQLKVQHPERFTNKEPT